jgi:hypothetical protein
MRTHLSPAQLAAIYPITVNTLAKHRVAGTGVPFTRWGRRILYKTSDIEEYLAANARKSTSAQSPPPCP